MKCIADHPITEGEESRLCSEKKVRESKSPKKLHFGLDAMPKWQKLPNMICISPVNIHTCATPRLQLIRDPDSDRKSHEAL